MSKREELRRRRQQRAQQRYLALIGLVVLISLGAVGYVIYENTRPIGEIASIERYEYPFVDGKALGPADARVVVQEFADFQ